MRQSTASVSTPSISKRTDSAVSTQPEAATRTSRGNNLLMDGSSGLDLLFLGFHDRPDLLQGNLAAGQEFDAADLAEQLLLCLEQLRLVFLLQALLFFLGGRLDRLGLGADGDETLGGLA